MNEDEQCTLEEREQLEHEEHYNNLYEELQQEIDENF